MPKKCDKCGKKIETVETICSFKLTSLAGIKFLGKPIHVCPDCFQHHCSYCGRKLEDFVKDSDGQIGFEKARYSNSEKFFGFACPICWKKITTRVAQQEYKAKLAHVKYEITVVCAACGGFNNCFMPDVKGERYRFCSVCRDKFRSDNSPRQQNMYNRPARDFRGWPER